MPAWSRSAASDGCDGVGSAISAYLENHAEPEARLATALDARYTSAVVVPVCAEAASFVAGILPALGPDSLLIVVVNARDDHPSAVHADSAACLAELVARARGRAIAEAPPAWLGSIDEVATLVIDRASAGQRLPMREGVGLARKIGLDLALALRRLGRLESRWLHTTDADAVLPADYLALGSETPAAAMIYPFRHLPSGDAALDRAHAIYELRLRHYVRGLRQAGSPYAFHAIGSTIAVDAESYAAVRGMPRRAAGEDFHLLAKLRKLAPVLVATTEPLGLRARRSARTPFGTGRAVERLLADEETQMFEHPAAFDLLGVWLAVLTEHAARDLGSPHQAAVARAPAFGAVLDRALARLEVDGGLARAFAHTPSHRRLARAHEWFDALRTLRFMHALRDAGLADLSWRQALARASFHQGLPRDDPFESCALLAAREAGG